MGQPRREPGRCGLGVSWEPRGSGRHYKVRITWKGKVCNLGRFKTACEARRAFDQAAIQLRGAEARTNYPPGSQPLDVPGVEARLEVFLRSVGDSDVVPAATTSTPAPKAAATAACGAGDSAAVLHTAAPPPNEQQQQQTAAAGRVKVAPVPHGGCHHDEADAASDEMMAGLLGLLGDAEQQGPPSSHLQPPPSTDVLQDRSHDTAAQAATAGHPLIMTGGSVHGSSWQDWSWDASMYGTTGGAAGSSAAVQQAWAPRGLATWLAASPPHPSSASSAADGSSDLDSQQPCSTRAVSPSPGSTTAMLQQAAQQWPLPAAGEFAAPPGSYAAPTMAVGMGSSQPPSEWRGSRGGLLPAAGGAGLVQHKLFGAVVKEQHVALPLAGTWPAAGRAVHSNRHYDTGTMAPSPADTGAIRPTAALEVPPSLAALVAVLTGGADAADSQELVLLSRCMRLLLNLHSHLLLGCSTCAADDMLAWLAGLRQTATPADAPVLRVFGQLVHSLSFGRSGGGALLSAGSYVLIDRNHALTVLEQVGQAISALRARLADAVTPDVYTVQQWLADVTGTCPAVAAVADQLVMLVRT